jgi:hypothetical protein
MAEVLFSRMHLLICNYSASYHLTYYGVLFRRRTLIGNPQDNEYVTAALSRLRQIRIRIERGVLSFVKAIFTCGLLELPLRGHSDSANIRSSRSIFDLPDSRFGCFNGLLYLMMDSGNNFEDLMLFASLFSVPYYFQLFRR